jgi:hypothetical protein
MSGLQAGANRRSSLKRAPAACSAFRSRISGAVFLLIRPARCPLREVATHCCSVTSYAFPNQKVAPGGTADAL